MLIGNGEPRITVTGAGRGGRATHLALRVARGIAGLENVAFLAAGTDDRDGSSDASGAVVDGATWKLAEELGLRPGEALRRFDTYPLLAQVGRLVRGPGTSNLLNLHRGSVKETAHRRGQGLGKVAVGRGLAPRRPRANPTLSVALPARASPAENLHVFTAIANTD